MAAPKKDDESEPVMIDLDEKHANEKQTGLMIITTDDSIILDLKKNGLSKSHYLIHTTNTCISEQLKIYNDATKEDVSHTAREQCKDLLPLLRALENGELMPNNPNIVGFIKRDSMKLKKLYQLAICYSLAQNVLHDKPIPVADIDELTKKGFKVVIVKKESVTSTGNIKGKVIK